MHIKIYFDDKSLFLCDAIDETTEPLLHHDDAVFIDEFDSHAIKSMIHEMQQPQVHAGVFKHHDLEELKKGFWKKYKIIIAGGGLVFNEKQEVLMIFRRGKWDLPKGKLDKGETIEQCAVREVMEETGLKDLTVESPLMVTYHTYHEGTKFYLKESHWFTMRVSSQQKLIPQTEEDILEIKWVDPAALKDFFPISFPSVVDVLRAGVLI